MILWPDLLILLAFGGLVLRIGSAGQRRIPALILLGCYSVAGYHWLQGAILDAQVAMILAGLIGSILLAYQARSAASRMLAYTAASMMVSAGLVYWVLTQCVQPIWNVDVGVVNNAYSDMILLKCYFILSTAAHLFWLVLSLVTLRLHRPQK